MQVVLATGKAKGPWVADVLPRLQSQLPQIYLQVRPAVLSFVFTCSQLGHHSAPPRRPHACEGYRRPQTRICRRDRAAEHWTWEMHAQMGVYMYDSASTDWIQLLHMCRLAPSHPSSGSSPAVDPAGHQNSYSPGVCTLCGVHQGLLITCPERGVLLSRPLEDDVVLEAIEFAERHGEGACRRSCFDPGKGMGCCCDCCCC